MCPAMALAEEYGLQTLGTSVKSKERDTMQNNICVDRRKVNLDRMGTLISIYSRTAKQAMENVLAFCLGMLVTHCFAAALSHGAYSMKFIIGWTVFALCSPVMAYFAWLTKGRGIFAKIVGVGIVAVSILSSILLFDRLRIYDFLIDGMLIYFLFFKKVHR